MLKRNKKYTAVLMSALFVLSSSCFASAAYGDTSAKNTSRIWGQNKYETSEKICEVWGKSKYAVIATGDGYADALCAAPLAKLYDAPIILTEPSKLSTDAEAALKNLNVSEVFIIGGESVVSNAVTSSICALGIKDTSIERIAGKDRYQTSELIAKKVVEKTGKTDDVVLASGEGYADALSVAPIAAIKGMPILLTEKTDIPENIESFITTKGIKGAYVVGGEVAVSDKVKTKLDNLLPNESKRLSGKTRYETNISIIKEFEKDLKFDSVYIAQGDGYADALSGAALAAKNGMPMILINSITGSDAALNYLKGKGKDIKNIVAIGGEKVVPSVFTDEIAAIDPGDDNTTPSVPPDGGPGGPIPEDPTTEFKNGNITIDVTGAKVIINISDGSSNGLIMVKGVVKNSDKIVYMNECNIKDGKCQIITEFDRGDYTLYVKSNAKMIPALDFTIN